MEIDKMDELKNKVEGKLQQKITDLEAVKIELEEDLKSSSGEEKEKNENLLNAATHLLVELKQAQLNIHSLINNQ